MSTEMDHVDEMNPVDALMRRVEFLRKLRKLEQQDEQERRETMDDVYEDAIKTTGGILVYENFLSHQRVYDDLKHVDCNYIDFGGLVIEQDKSLGKGGLCWDAAFILGEYLSKQTELGGKTILELGTGTGLCGMMVAKALPVHVDLTDLPNLMDLLQRNVQANFGSPSATSNAEANHDSSDAGTVSAFVLDWSSPPDKQYDVVIGADVVASLYDPVALAQTIYQTTHSDSIVYISFKERLSTIHRQFEEAMRKHFDDIQFTSSTDSRNRNPAVRILIARHRVVDGSHSA